MLSTTWVCHNRVMKVTDKIITITGPEPGPTLAIFAGMHGNETVGVLALEEVLPQLKLSRGTLHVAYANVPALEQGVRMIKKNLNRCFITGNDGDTYEDERARQLMTVLDECDALLDLHAFNEDAGDPFIICEESAFDVAAKLEPEIISTGWAKAEPGGTDGYMHLLGKVGICVECGPLSQADKYKPFAIQTIKQLLKVYEIIDEEVRLATNTKRIIQAYKTVRRTAKDFELDPTLRSFQLLNEGQIIGSQRGKEYLAQRGDYIIFPRPQAAIGGEAFILGREI